MEEILKKEGIKAEDALQDEPQEVLEEIPEPQADTSAAPEAMPELNSTPVPTEEDKELLQADDGTEGEEEQITEQVLDTPEEEPVIEEETEVEISAEPQPQIDEGGIHDTDLNQTDIPGVTEKPALFTQEQVNEIVGRTRVETRDKTQKLIYDRYGVHNEDEMDELFGNSQRYDTLKEQYDSEKAERAEHEKCRDAELCELKEQIALMQSGIDSNRYEDAKLILRGKGLEVNLDNIQNELATHPEWKQVEVKAEEEKKPFVKKESLEPVSKISVLGNSGEPNPSSDMDEKSKAMRLFDM